MKNLLTIVFIALLTFQLSAQEISVNTHIDKELNQYYIDLTSKAATLNGKWGLLGGMRIGYNINYNISVGIVGNGLIPERLGGSYINQNEKNNLHLGYGGVEVLYKYTLSERFNLTGLVMIGAGRVDYENLDNYDYFFIMEPGLAISYYLTNWLGFGYSIGYRIASGVKYSNLSNTNISGWAINLDFKFGF